MDTHPAPLSEEGNPAGPQTLLELVSRAVGSTASDSEAVEVVTQALDHGLVLIGAFTGEHLHAEAL